MNKTNYLIIYSKIYNKEENPYFGMKLFDNKKEANQYMKCVDLLSEDGASFEVGDFSDSYSIDDFSEFKLSSSDLKFLDKFFDLGDDNPQIGVFPNAIDDAYEYDLIEDNEEIDDDI